MKELDQAMDEIKRGLKIDKTHKELIQCRCETIEQYDTVTFPDGSKYKGEIKNNKPNGYGIVTFPSGQK